MAIDAAHAAESRARSKNPRQRNMRRPRNGALFWWTILIIILGIGVVLSWFFSIYIFNHPNEPLPYQILNRLGKLEPPKVFPADKPPGGQFRKPRVMLEEDFRGFEQVHLDYINASLLRDYLENFRRSEGVSYVSGNFVIEHVRALDPANEPDPGDMFSTGLVWRGRSADFPNASVEFVLPTATPVPVELLSVGDVFDIKRSYFAAVVHVARPDDRSMCFTLIPLTYGDIVLEDNRRISLAPPKRLELEARWPLSSAEDADPSVLPAPAPDTGV